MAHPLLKPYRLRPGLAILCLVPIVSAALYVGSARPADGPRLAMPPYPLDLGKGKAGTILDDQFQIRNVGTEPLTFRLAASCGCSDLNPRIGTIPPGESQEIHVGVRLREEGVERLVTITVATNDPRTPSATYTVRAACASPLLLTPHSADFGQVLAGQSKRIDVRVRDGDDRPLDPSGDLRVESDNPYFKVGLAADEAGDRVVRITLAEDAPPPAGIPARSRFG